MRQLFLCPSTTVAEKPRRMGPARVVWCGWVSFFRGALRPRSSQTNLTRTWRRPPSGGSSCCRAEPQHMGRSKDLCQEPPAPPQGSNQPKCKLCTAIDAPLPSERPRLHNHTYAAPTSGSSMSGRLASTLYLTAIGTIFGGSTSLLSVLSTSPAVATLCTSGAWQCEGSCWPSKAA